MRPFASTAWQAVESSLHDQAITALSYDRQRNTFYAGTMKEGLFQATLHAPPLSERAPLRWTAIGGPFQKQWIRLIVLDPSDFSVIYVGTINQGLFKSTDHGASWTAINAGLPSKDIESLVIDPQDPRRLYVGTHNDGPFLSRDGGQTWKPPEQLQVEPLRQVIASLISPSASAPSREPRAVPPSFAKCNQCHGWTDPALSQKATYWRVSPNSRDWRPTVQRMGPGARLTPQEEEEIITFLTNYSRQRSHAP